MNRRAPLALLVLLLTCAPAMLASPQVSPPPPPGAAPADGQPLALASDDPPVGIAPLDYLDLRAAYATHLATASDVIRMMEGQGVFDPSADYRRVVDGHGTGLVPPTAEEYEDMVGSATLVDGVSLASGSSLPGDLDLSGSPYFPAVGDQGGLQACVAWTVGYYTAGFLQAREHDWTEAHLGTNDSQLMSPAWAFNLLNGGLDKGVAIPQVIELLATHGQATMATMPYDGADYRSWGDDDAWEEAPLHRVHGSPAFTTCDSPEVIKAWLAEGYLVPTMIPSYNFVGLGRDDPVISSAEFEARQPDHGVTIVGYDDSLVVDGDVGAFKLVNSWGASWGTVWDGDGFFWLTYDAFAKVYVTAMLVRDRIDYQPSLMATFEHSSPGVVGATIQIGVDCNPSATWGPEWTWSRDQVPDRVTADVSDLAGWRGIGSFYLRVSTWTTPVPTITSFSVETHEGGYSPGDPTRVVRSEEAPRTAPCTLNVTWCGVHVGVDSPGNGTWNRGDVTVSGHADQNLSQTVWDTGFEGDADIYWTNQDANPASGADTWGESRRRSHGGEVSMWCAGSDGGAALFDDLDGSATFGSDWRTTSLGPDPSPWSKVTSGYRGCGPTDRIAVATSEGLDNVTEWLMRASPVDCSVYENLTLSYYVDYVAGDGDGWGRVLWANGSTYPSFTLLEEFKADALGHSEMPVPFLDGEARVYLAFAYHGTNDGYMAIDDVALRGDKVGYDANMRAQMTGYMRAPQGVDNVTLEFSYWLDSASSDVLTVSYYSQDDGRWHDLWSQSGRERSWTDVSLDLPLDFAQVRFEFRSGIPRPYEGAFLDDIRLLYLTDLDEVLVQLDGSEPQAAEGLTNWSFSWGPTGIPSGLWNVTARANYGTYHALDRLTLGLDSVPPWFGVDASPDEAWTDHRYIFSIPVADDVGIETVWVEHWYGDGPRTNGTMVAGEGGLWELATIVEDTLDDLHYVIGCVDIAGNVNATAERSVPVIDVNGPGIINEGTKSWATTGDPFEFTLTAHDNVGLKSCILWYAFGEEELAPFEMEVVEAYPSSGNTLYSLWIDVPSDLAGNISYSYEIEDLYGNVFLTHVDIIRVRDNDAPSIVEDRTPGTAPMGGDLTFEVVVSDNVGFGSVQVEYSLGDGDGVTAPMATGEGAWVYALTIHIPEDEPGPLSYRFIVMDRGWNYGNGTLREVTLVDTIPPEILDEHWGSPIKGLDMTLEIIATDNVGVEGSSLTYWFNDGVRTVVELDDELRVVFHIPRDAGGRMHVMRTVWDAAGNEVVKQGEFSLLNTPPRVGNVPVWELVEGQEGTCDLAPYITDQNDDLDDLWIVWIDDTISISGLTLRACYDVAVPDRMILIDVTDGETPCSFVMMIRILNVNDAPVITSISPPNGSGFMEGEVITLSVNASDEDGDYLTVTWYDGGTVLGTGATMEVSNLEVGTRTVRVTVSDGEASVSEDLTLTITREEETAATGWWLGGVAVLVILALALLGWFLTRER